MEDLKKHLTLLILIIGIIISIGVGILLNRYNIPLLDSIKLTLLGSILTTVLGILVDMRKNQDDLVKALDINKHLNKDENLRVTLYKLTDDYIKVTANLQERLFAEEAKTTVERCAQKVAELANGQLKINNEHKRLDYIFSKIAGPKVASIKAITWLAKGESNWWESSRGKKYLELQKDAIQSRGAKVTRILIISNQTKPDLKRLILSQKDIGIKIMAVREKSVHQELLDNSLICDDKWFTKSKFDRRGKSNGGLVSINETDVSPALQQWNRLIDQAKEIQDVDKDLDRV